MRVLIIGASGFIGNASYETFARTAETFGTDFVNNTDHAVYIDSDFSITQKLIADKQPELIINCAGSSNIQRSFEKPEEDYQLNTALVAKLLDVIRIHSPESKFINLSSAAVYGNPEKLPVKENDPPAPLSPYGKNKLLSEQLIREKFQSFGIQGLSVRIFSAYGIGLKRQFFYDLSTKFIQHPDQVSLFGNGKESRDFIYVRDIVNAFSLLYKHAAFDGSVINLASGQQSFIQETAEAYAQLFNYKGEITFNGQQIAGYPINWQADIHKIESIGFRPEISLTEGMELYAQWIKRIFKL